VISIEVHHTELNGKEYGTLVAVVGAGALLAATGERSSHIAHARDAEQFLLGYLANQGEFDRAYFLQHGEGDKPGEPLAVWQHDGDGVFRCIGRAAHYDGDWQDNALVYSGSPLIAWARQGRTAPNATPQAWARQQLTVPVATAIMLNAQGTEIVAAWERTARNFAYPTLRARGPLRW